MFSFSKCFSSISPIKKSVLFHKFAQRNSFSSNPKGKLPKVLVVVESPVKAGTIQKYLETLDDAEYKVLATHGHFYEFIKLKDNSLGVDIENSFKKLQDIMPKSVKIMREIQNACYQSDKLVLATDEDREGEAISWHIIHYLQPTIPYERIVFNEITKSAIINSFNNPRGIDMKLVSAQNARSVLDRLVGYSISPLLWTEFCRIHLSAGRVQSCGLRFIVDREFERWKFNATNLYSISTNFNIPNTNGDGTALGSVLKYWDNKQIATSFDFDKLTGELTNKDSLILDENKSKEILQWLSHEDTKFEVVQKESTSGKLYSPNPFVTSNLQIAASKLGYSPMTTMRIAGSLYENGYITYPRTDSKTFSADALEIGRRYILETFGENYLGSFDKKKKNAKFSQEAHEAIRPSLSENGGFITPQEIEGKVSSFDFKLYSLIYYQTLGSMMSDAVTNTISLTVRATNPSLPGNHEALFKIASTNIVFDGFKILKNFKNERSSNVLESLDINSILSISTQDERNNDLIEDKSEETDQSNDSIQENQGEDLKNIDEENSLNSFVGFKCRSFQSLPKARFTVATFIKELEENGVGRPSTYSSSFSTLLERKYISFDLSKRFIFPTLLGIAVDNYLTRKFPGFFEKDFTSQMEESLDKIADGELVYLDFLNSFYFGSKNSSTGSVTKGLKNYLLEIEEKLNENRIKDKVFYDLPAIRDLGLLYYHLRTVWFEPVNSKAIWNLSPLDVQAFDPTRINSNFISQLTSKPGVVFGQNESREIGTYRKRPIYLFPRGLYGPYIKCGNINVSLGKISPDDLTEEIAIDLFEKRVLKRKTSVENVNLETTEVKLPETEEPKKTPKKKIAPKDKAESKIIASKKAAKAPTTKEKSQTKKTSSKKSTKKE